MEHLRQRPGRNRLAGLRDGVFARNASAADAVVDDVLQLGLRKVDGQRRVVHNVAHLAVEGRGAGAGIDVALRKAVGLDQRDLAVHKFGIVAGENTVLTQAGNLARQIEILRIARQQAGVEITIPLVLRKDDLAVVVGVRGFVFQHELGKGMAKIGFQNLILGGAAQQRGVFLAAGEAPLLAGEQNLVQRTDEIIGLRKVPEIQIPDVIRGNDAENGRPRADIDAGPFAAGLLADVGENLLILPVVQAGKDRLGENRLGRAGSGRGDGNRALPVAGVVFQTSVLQLTLNRVVDELLVLGGYIAPEKIRKLTVKDAFVDVTEPEQSGLGHRFTSFRKKDKGKNAPRAHGKTRAVRTAHAIQRYGVQRFPFHALLYSKAAFKSNKARIWAEFLLDKPMHLLHNETVPCRGCGVPRTLPQRMAQHP